MAVYLMVSLKTKKVFCDCSGRIKAKTRNGESAYSTVVAVVVYSTVGHRRAGTMNTGRIIVFVEIFAFIN